MHRVRRFRSFGARSAICLLLVTMAFKPLICIAFDAQKSAVHADQWPMAQWPFPLDPALEQRVRTLLATMTLEEKVGQIIQADIGSVTPAEARQYHLGAILAGGNSKPGGGRVATPAPWLAAADAYYHASMDVPEGQPAIPVLFGIDAVHGNNDVTGATIFPQNSALGAMRDPALVRKIAEATAEEVRAIGIEWTFAPSLAVPRDDRWGRSYEGYSENPELVAQYAAAAVEGLQGRVGTPQFLDASHVLASAKHFLGDGGTKNGKDQGDTEVGETELHDIHGAGYPPAISAGVQTVMASFSGWNGVKMSANKGLLTDVLKDHMHFGGFVVGDWNAHGQVPGCSNDDCPQAINAGLDMLMAPDSWRGLYQHTLAEVKSGVIPTTRLDDAVARILRVKLRLGLFNAGAPSAQPLGGKFELIGSPSHRALARQAVRESLVLLKNQGHILPLNPRQRILVAGDGADNIPKQCGGWTLSWQGTGTSNSDFPHAQSIWSGIREQVDASDGTATLSVDGSFKQKPDVAIVVFGEDPYAEFQGDLPNVAYKPGDDDDLKLIQRLRAQGVPVVAVFLSGRPLWVNREINAANAFVAAWLPGSEGGGVADVLLRKRNGGMNDDFHGKLAYSWPRDAAQTPLNVGQSDYHPQFAYGYGLSYADNGDLPHLSEDAGIRLDGAPSGMIFARGKPVLGYALRLGDAAGKSTRVTAMPAASLSGDLRVRAIDYQVQEDARRLAWSGHGSAQAMLIADTAQDLTRQTNGDMQLVATLRVDVLAPEGTSIGVGCGKDCSAFVPVSTSLPHARWLRVGVPLKCFGARGANMQHIDMPFVLRSQGNTRIDLASVAIAANADRTMDCAGK